MNRLIIIGMVSFSFLLAISACDKTDGPVDSSGNVSVNGRLFNVHYSNWTSNQDETDWTTELRDTAITREVISGGAVIVYYVSISGSDTNYVQLPYTYKFYEYGVTLATNTVFIDVSQTDASSITNPGDYTFQVVVISPKKLEQYPAFKQREIPHNMLQQTIGPI